MHHKYTFHHNRKKNLLTATKKYKNKWSTSFFTKHLDYIFPSWLLRPFAPDYLVSPSVSLSLLSDHVFPIHNHIFQVEARSIFFGQKEACSIVLITQSTWLFFLKMIHFFFYESFSPRLPPPKYSIISILPWPCEYNEKKSVLQLLGHFCLISIYISSYGQ